MLKLKSTGFTLIELIMTLVIVGILASVALPKLANLSQSAHINTINHVAGLLRETADNARLLCIASPETGCSIKNRGQWVWIKGKYYGMNYGWVGSGSGLNNGLIDTMIDYNGFTVTESSVGTSNQNTKFALTSAPTPGNCAVTYYSPAYQNGKEPRIEVDTTGC